jgi:hypothetical protein
VITAKQDALTSWALEKRKLHGMPFIDASTRPPVSDHMAIAARMPEAFKLFGPRVLNICFWGYLTSGPWGGGAHFLLALSRSFERLGHQVHCSLGC